MITIVATGLASVAVSDSLSDFCYGNLSPIVTS